MSPGWSPNRILVPQSSNGSFIAHPWVFGTAATACGYALELVAWPNLICTYGKPGGIAIRSTVCSYRQVKHITCMCREWFLNTQAFPTKLSLGFLYNIKARLWEKCSFWRIMPRKWTLKAVQSVVIVQYCEHMGSHIGHVPHTPSGQRHRTGQPRVAWFMTAMNSVHQEL